MSQRSSARNACRDGGLTVADDGVDGEEDEVGGRFRLAADNKDHQHRYSCGSTYG